MPLILTADTNPGTASWSAASHTVGAAGTATILLGNDAIIVALGATLDGSPVTATMNDTDATATNVETCSWDGGGNLTITANANATANADVFYIVALAV